MPTTEHRVVGGRESLAVEPKDRGPSGHDVASPVLVSALLFTPPGPMNARTRARAHTHTHTFLRARARTLSLSLSLSKDGAQSGHLCVCVCVCVCVYEHTRTHTGGRAGSDSGLLNDIATLWGACC